jgi:hypothetical protein
MNKIIKVKSCWDCPHWKFDNKIGKGKCEKIYEWIFRPLEIHKRCPLLDEKEETK